VVSAWAKALAIVGGGITFHQKTKITTKPHVYRLEKGFPKTSKIVPGAARSQPRPQESDVRQHERIYIILPAALR